MKIKTMNAETRKGTLRERAEECEVGDLLDPELVPDWPISEKEHHFVLPGQVAVDPNHQIPVTTPLVSWRFEIREGSGLWMRVA